MSKVYFKPRNGESFQAFSSIDDVTFLVNNKQYNIEDVRLSRKFKDGKLGCVNCYWVYINDIIPFGIMSIETK